MGRVRRAVPTCLLVTALGCATTQAPASLAPAAPEAAAPPPLRASERRSDADRQRAAGLAQQAALDAASGRHDEALASARLAVRLDSANPSAWLQWALAGEIANEDAEEVAARYRVAIRLEPNDARAHTLLASWQQLRGEEDDALRGYDRALLVDPGFLEAHVRRANLRADGGDLLGAAADYRAALALDRRHVPALVGLAAVSETAGDLAAAERAWLQVIALYPDAALYRSRLIGFYRRTGQRERAAHAEQELKRLQPPDRRRLRALPH